MPRRAQVTAAALWAALALLGGCGGSGDAVGGTHAPSAKRPVELELRTHDDVLVHVGDFRGQVVVLYLFATFDGVSQAALRPLARFVRHHPEVYVLGVAVQPNAKPLIGAWHAALAPPFAVTYSPEDRLSQGTTDLGAIGTVPTFVILDKHGQEVARHVGMVSEGRLDQLVAEAAP